MSLSARLTASAALLAVWLGFGPAAAAQESVNTFAGSPAVAGSADGPRAGALFNDPAGLAVAADGTIYVADSGNHTIRRIGTNGVVSTLAGLAGSPGGVDGTGVAARFDTPTGLAVDGTGNVIVADTGNHTVRKVTPAGVVSTLAGLAGESGFTNAVGAAARFSAPIDVCAGFGGVVYVADSGNHLIRTIAADRAVGTLAGEPGVWGSADGPGSSARFNNPVGLALDGAGNLFVADANNHTIRRVSPSGHVDTFAGFPESDGSRDGTGGTARFAKPAELAIDREGNLFVADSFNHVIRRITPGGEVSTVAGRPGDDGASDGANGAGRFFNPYGIIVLPDGQVMVADTYNQLLRVVFVPFRLEVQRVQGADRMVITWPAVPGKTYRVQYKENAGDPAWSDWGGPVTASGTSFSQTNEMVTSRFYRVTVSE